MQSPSADPHADQAAGLRRLFAGAAARFVPAVSNPHVACGGVLLERLSTALAERGAHVLVVDAGERAGVANEMALIDLAQCIERLSPQVSYLAARGLAIRFVDATGSTRRFLDRLAEAAPRADAIVVHAPPAEICRTFGHGRQRGVAFLGDDAPCPIVFAEDRPASVTHAYAAMKLVAERAGFVVSELLLGAAPSSPRAERIAAKLASCADHFFAGVLRDWARVDPAGDPCDAPGDDLRRIVASRLAEDAAHRHFSHAAERRAAAWVAA
jgi:flagellar biosynthesis protein FlhG